MSKIVIKLELPDPRGFSAGDWLFAAAIAAANVVPWALFIWGATR